MVKNLSKSVKERPDGCKLLKISDISIFDLYPGTVILFSGTAQLWRGTERLVPGYGGFAFGYGQRRFRGTAVPGDKLSVGEGAVPGNKCT